MSLQESHLLETPQDILNELLSNTPDDSKKRAAGIFQKLWTRTGRFDALELIDLFVCFQYVTETVFGIFIYIFMVSV